MSRLCTRIGAVTLKQKLKKTHWKVNSMFAGAGFPDVALRSIVSAARPLIGPGKPDIRWGIACDNSGPSQKVCTHMFGHNRCMFGNIFDWFETPELLMQKTLGATVTMKPSAHCITHDRHCRLPSKVDRGAVVPVDIAGPPCPPWSKMGNQLGIDDVRFGVHQAWVADVRRRQPWLVIFENVIGYPIALLRENLGDLYELDAAIVDPRSFGIPMGRARIYVALRLKGRMKWVGKPLAEALGDLAVRTVMNADAFFTAPGALKPPRALNKTEHKHLALIIGLPATDRLQRAPIIDLFQTPQRGRCSLKDGSLPTFTTKSGSLYHRRLKRVLTPLQMMLAMGFPADEKYSKAMGVDFVDLVALGLKDSDIVELAGNGMSCHVVAAVLLTVMMCVEPSL